MPCRSSGEARRVLLWSSACLAVLAWSPAGAGSAGGGCAGATPAQELRCLVNAERRQRGLGALRASRPLARAAATHAVDMVRRDYFSHLTPEGAAVEERVRQSGFLHGAHDWGLGEAIGYASRDRRAAARLVAGFMDSATHRKLLMEPAFDRIGIGVASGWPIPGRRGRGLTVVVAVGRARGAR